MPATGHAFSSFPIRGMLSLLITAVISSAAFSQDISSKDSASPDGDAATRSTGKAEKVQAAPQTKIKVVFDEKTPGVVYIESNGERLRVDATSRVVEEVPSIPTGTGAAAAAPDQTVADAKKARPDDDDEDKYAYDRGEEPYDFRVVDIPTPKNVPKGSWNLTFTHRFSEPIRPLDETATDLFGLDSFAVSSFGLAYGITDKFYVSAYRSPLCQRGVCKVIEVGAGYNWLSHSKESPIALTTYASIEGNDNFTEEYTYNLQMMLSARLGKRVYLFFSPAAHINSNGQKRFNPRASDYFPPATIASTYTLPTHTASFGFGASVMITPNVLAMFDFVPRTGFKMGQLRPIFDSNFRVTGFTNESHPTFGIGVQRNIGKHSFALTLSNTQGTTTARYNSSTLGLAPKHLILGFNLSRRF